MEASGQGPGLQEHSSPGAPRVAPGGRAEIGLINHAIARVVGLGMGGPPPNVLTTLAKHRGLFRRWLPFAAGLMPRGRLPRRDTELLILRVAHNTGCEYELHHHERLGRAAGLTEEEIARVADGADATGWGRREAALLVAADELHAERAISDELWAVLQEHLDEQELIELCLLVGHYEMLAMTLNSLRVQLDPAPPRQTLAMRLLRRLDRDRRNRMTT